MISFEVVLCLIALIGTTYLILKKPRRIRSFYQHYFAQLNRSLKEKRGGTSACIIDLDRLDSNLRCIRTTLGSSYKLRLATKSLPSLGLLKCLMTRAETNRLMVFSEPFLAVILTELISDSLDILLGKPLPVEAFMRLRAYDRWSSVHWLIDTKERLNEYLSYSQQQQPSTQIKISLEIDVGLYRGGFQTIEDFSDAVRIIQQNSQYLELTGLMGYDGHVPHVPFYINRERAIEKAFVRAQDKYRQFVDALSKQYDPKAIRQMTFNSGGSQTFMYYSQRQSITPVNDIAIGSGFLMPQQFSNLAQLGCQPALFLASPVLKKIGPSPLPHAETLTALLYWWDPNLKVSFVMLDGGWPGELICPIGVTKNYWWEAHQFGYTNLLPNQTIIGSSDENTLQIGDFVFSHPWEGDSILCFKKLVLYRHSGIVGEWDTYSGGNGL